MCACVKIGKFDPSPKSLFSKKTTIINVCLYRLVKKFTHLLREDLHLQKTTQIEDTEKKGEVSKK